MDDHEHPNRQLQPTGSLINAGTTPLWHSSQLRPEESAMRSTLPSPGCITSMRALPQQPQLLSTPRLHANGDCDPMAIDSLIHPTNSFSPATFGESIPHHSDFTPINSYKLSRPHKAPINTATYSLQTGRFLSDMDIDMNQIDSSEVEQGGGTVLQVDESLRVDKDDGRVWHLGNANDSFSGTFVNDNPEQIDTYARHLANRIREERERPERMAFAAQLLERVRAVVNGEGAVSVERTSYVEHGEPVICERPGCFHKAVLPADVYYVNVAWELFLCLRCFEMLWAGNFTEVDDQPDPFRRDSAVGLMPAQFDGQSDYSRHAPRRSARLRSNSSAVQHKTSAPSPPLRATNQVFQSRWAVPETEVQPEVPVHTPPWQINVKSSEHQVADEPIHDSPSSIDSKGKWIHPPVPVQRIAHRLEAGATLTETDKGVFAVWQAASGVQLWWNHHLLKTKMTQDYYDGISTNDEGLFLEHLESEADAEWERLKDMESKIGMRMKDCYGRELSFMLSEAAQKKKDLKN